jgi:predicted exporter
MKGLLGTLLILAGLGGVGWFASQQLVLDHRLDAFLPLPTDAEQALVVDQISAGPGGRLILAAVSGAPAEQLAEFSRLLAAAWRELPGIERVDNGEFELDTATRERLMANRFVLLDDIDQRLSDEAIAAALEERLSELAMAGRQVEALIRQDPLGMLPALADQLAAVSVADSFDDVWLDADQQRALLVAVSAYPPFAMAEQAELLQALKEQFRQLDDQGQLTLTLAGSPVIGVDSATRSRSNAIFLSTIGSVFLLLVLSWAWRSPTLVLAGALPLAAGIVSGLLVTALAFDQVHGLTLAFGFTLLGVALDYPIHLFGHASGRRLDQSARSIRTPLLLGAASTLIAYITIWASTSPGLAQLGAFSAAGLAAAALTTLLLPRLGLNAPERIPYHLPAWPRLPWLPLVLAVIASGLLLGQGERRWSTDLTRLSPINTELLARDLDLRQAISAGDVRHMLMVSASDLETVLQQAEHTTVLLAGAREQGLISGWQTVTDLVPSQQQQDLRRAAWPEPDILAERLQAAEPAFQASAFEPFLADFEHFLDQPPLDASSWQGTAVQLRIDSLLARTDEGWRALILPAGLPDADALAAWLEQQQAPASLIDLRATSEAMVERYRKDAGLSLVIALGLIAGLLLLRLGSLRLAGLVLLPPLAAITCTAAIISIWHEGLTIVHLIGLLLAGGIGLDFAIFSRTLGGERLARIRTNRAINLCAVSSGGVFLILGQSDIGLLHMLGTTVAVGILLSWLFARISQPPCRTSL